MISGIPDLNIIGNAATFVGSGVPALDMFLNPYNPYKDARGRADPIMSYNWYVELPGYDFDLGSTASSLLGGGAIGSLVGETVGSAVSKATGLPYEYVEEATLPFRNYSTRQVFRNGNFKKYPNQYEVGNMSLVVYADSAGLSLRYLNAWHNSPMIKFSSTTADTLGGRWRAPGKIKRKIIAVILAPNHQKVAYLEYTGCWLTSISEINVDSSPNTRVAYRVEISVDDVFVTVATMAGLVDAITPADIPL